VSIVPAETDDGCGLRLAPRALSLGYRFGSDTLLVLLDLAAHATDSPEGIVVTASYREVARRLGVSKDTVGRRMAVLRGAGVVVELGEDSVDRFESRSYRLYLDFAGVTRERSQVPL
jgi:DNA-binding transcriptional ArsR family regulator